MKSMTERWKEEGLVTRCNLPKVIRRRGHILLTSTYKLALPQLVGTEDRFSNNIIRY